MVSPDRTRAVDEAGPAIAAKREEIARIHMDVYGRVATFVRRIVHNTEDAEQIIQNAGAQLWLRWTRNPLAFEPPENLQKYAEQVARNNYRSLLREQGRWEERFEEVEDIDELEPPPSSDSLDEAVAVELQDRIDVVTDSMPRRMRQVYDLKVAGWENAEVAAELGITENTVRSHYQHALQLLGPSIGPYLEDGR